VGARIQGSGSQKSKFWPFTSSSEPAAGDELPGAIKLAVHQAGDGKRFPKAGHTVVVHWSGKYTLPSTNGKAFFFDSSKRLGDTPFAFTVGKGEVVKCWDLAVMKMSVGEKATLTCPPDYAYGPNGYPPVIPPNATLTFEVELIDFK